MSIENKHMMKKINKAQSKFFKNKTKEAEISNTKNKIL
jgi:hypothetical protein